jgi:hypothetical protein
MIELLWTLFHRKQFPVWTRKESLGVMERLSLFATWIMDDNDDDDDDD